MTGTLLHSSYRFDLLGFVIFDKFRTFSIRTLLCLLAAGFYLTDSGPDDRLGSAQVMPAPPCNDCTRQRCA